MYKEFYIYKKTGTYSETLEAFGLANLINEILQRSNIGGRKITIENQDSCYKISSNKEITEETISNLSYFQVFKFIKKEINQELPNGITDYFDYPKNKATQDEYKERYKQIDKLKTEAEKKEAKKNLNEEKLSEFGKKIDPEFDVYREIIKNPYNSFSNQFINLHSEQTHFPLLIKEILNLYSQKISTKRNFKLIDEKPTAQQLYNPNQGKGLNKAKANNASMGNMDSVWISETLKISGALSMMICQFVKVGSSYDLKIFVPEFNETSFSEAKELILDFKKYLKSASPIKLDILNSLNFTTKFILNTPEYRGKVKKTINGFHSVYQKDLGNNKAVANISFIGTPDFVEYDNQEEARNWIEILEQQKNIISNIDEQGDSIQALQLYRNFLGSTGNNALEYFAKFSYWYSSYLMQNLTKGNKYVRTFKIEHLNKFYNYMGNTLSEIIQNDGFKSVAAAIRKSTVSLQYTPKDQRKFEIRYGLAQQLQNKSKSKEDLATFIGEFIGTYNAETGRNAEKNGGKAFRSNVKDVELIKFYELLDFNSPRLIGALLASYGFALSVKDKNGAELNEINTEELTETE
jgi:hypothetical protein